MKKKQIKSFNLLDVEDEVARKFNSCKKIKTVWQHIAKYTHNYFTPLATLCLVVAVGAKRQITVNQEELKNIVKNWSLEPTILFTEENLLSQYAKYLDKIGFKIPRSNTSMPLILKSKKTVSFRGVDVVKKITQKTIRQEIAERQPSLFDERLI